MDDRAVGFCGQVGSQLVARLGRPHDPAAAADAASRIIPF